MENMINKLAASFNATTGIDFKELRAEANLAYCEALLSYQEDKGPQLSTWVYRCVKNALINFCKKEQKHGRANSIDFYLDSAEVDETPYIVPDALLVTDPEPWEVMQQQFRGIARKVVDVVLELDHYSGTGKDMRGQVVEDLRAEGLSWPKVWSGIREVKMVLSSN